MKHPNPPGRSMAQKAVFFALLTFCLSKMGHTAHLFVNPSCSPNCTGIWSNAYSHLQDALDVATDGDTIWIASGTYYPTKDKNGTSTTGRTATFNLKPNLKIYGGFAGNETSPTQRDIASNPTILSGDLGTINSKSDNAYSVVYSESDGTDLLIDGITIRDGNANSTGGLESNGGGLYLWSYTELLIQNCTITHNYAQSGGGGIYVLGNADIEIDNCVISHNHADSVSGAGAGAGFWAEATSEVIIKNSLFENNRGKNGAAIVKAGGQLEIENVDFLQNKGHTTGGAVFITGSTLDAELVACRFIDNEGLAGGALANSAPGVELYDCIFYNNNALLKGGAVYNYSTGTGLTLSNCVFSDNDATYYGGAIHNGGQSGTAVHSILGVYNCTFSGNSAGTRGGAMYLHSDTGLVVNSIIWGNTASIGPDIFDYSSDMVMKHSLTQAFGTNGIDGNVVGSNPNFSNSSLPMGTNGKWADSDDGLIVGLISPALHAGDNSAILSGVSTDVSGGPRIKGTNVDMGAYEGRFICKISSIIYVDENATGFETGGCWGDAYRSLKMALDSTSVYPNVDSILVAEGTYIPDSTNRSVSFEMKSGISILGGYASGGSTYRDWITNETILSGDINDTTLSSDNSYTIVEANNIGTSAILDGFVIRDGNCNGGSGNGGAGMLVKDCSPSVRNCQFIDNHSPLKTGGAVLLNNASPVIERCFFTENTASGGGAIYGQDGSDAEIVNTVFYDNSTVNGGGALLFYDASGPEIINCTFFRNETDALGGGAILNVDNCDPDIGNCLFYGNLANNSSPGADIYNYTGSYNGSTVSPSNASVTHSFTQQFGTTGTDGNVVGLNPKFKDSVNTKGPDGYWFTIDDGLDLDTLSPAIDGGDTLLIPNGITLDLGGELRVENLLVDMGAYEGVAPCPIDTIIYVDSAAIGARSGGCWKHAFTDLHDALKVAQPGQQIWVAKGTYVPYLDKNHAPLASKFIHRASFRLGDGVKMYGGFSGIEDSLHQRDPKLNETILSGRGPTSSLGDNSYWVVSTHLASSETVIDGFTLSEGRGKGVFWTQLGGGAMYITRSDILINNCVFRNNTALGNYYSNFTGSGFSGSCIVNIGGSPTISNCHFYDNESKVGGAIVNYDDKWPHTGQAVYYYCNPTIVNCLFENNTAQHGGAIAHMSANKSGIIKNCVFRNNTATKYGGAMMVGKHSRVSVIECDFIENSADSLGGAVVVNGLHYADESRPYFEYCIFEDNDAGKAGGAMANIDRGSPNVHNSLFIENSAPKGGAVVNHILSYPTFTNNTFYKNAATDAGGAIATGHKSTTKLWNNLFDENEKGSTPSTTVAGADIEELTGYFHWRTVNAASNQAEHCFTQVYSTTGTSGNVVGGNPAFSNEGNPIGPDSLWRTTDDGLRLTGSSGAIDAGNEVYISSEIVEALGGDNRVQGKTADAGAYESNHGLADDIYPAANTDLQPFQGCPNLSITTKYIKADFGAKGDGVTDDTEAFVKASLYVNALNSASHRIKLVIDAGTYVVGKQLDSTESWTVTDTISSTSITFTNPNRVKKGINIFHITGAQNVTVTGINKPKIVMKSGLYFGGFDKNLTPKFISSLSPPSGYHSADVGNLFQLQNCNCTEVSNLELDGSEDELAQLGGVYGGHSSDGYQLAYDGVFIGNSKNVSIDNVYAHNFGRDGIDIGALPYYSHSPQDVFLRDVVSENNGRQGISWTAGDTLRALDCSFSYTGRCGNVTNSNPKAGIDIEPEGGRCNHGYFKNCKSVDNSGLSLISDYTYEGWKVAQIEFDNCLFWGTTAKTLWPKQMRKTSFKNCSIYGTMVHVSGSEQNDIMLFENCYISDMGPDGQNTSTPDVDGWVLFNMGTNPVLGIDTLPSCGSGDSTVKHGKIHYLLDLDTIQGVISVADSVICDDTGPEYYDWDLHSNSWFKFKGCEFEMHNKVFSVMLPMRSDFATYGGTINYQELRTFECNLFNFHSEDLQAVPGYGYAKRGGEFFNCGFYSNVFNDISPVEPGSGNANIAYTACSNGCPRYAFTIDVDVSKENHTDGNNYFTPITSPTNSYAPHSRIYRWTRIDYQVPSNTKF